MNLNTLNVAILVALAPIAAAQNDECATALPLALDVPTPFDTTLATLSAPAWPCATSTAPDLWYSVQFPATGIANVRTCGSLYDTALELFDGTCAALNSLACNDDSCGLGSSISFTATAGTTYLVRVGGFGTSSGTGTILATQPGPVTNDECATAIALTIDVPEAFDTSTATLSLPAWTCATSTAPDIWFRYTASADNTVEIDTCGSLYDTALEVFSGTCGSLTVLGCNDDSCGPQSSLSFAGTAGTTYLIRVGGFGTAFGAGTIVATEIPPPPANCVTTLFTSNNSGAVGGTVYFTLNTTQNITLGGLETNFTATAGTPVGLSVYTTPGTHAGNEANAAVWTLAAMDDGTAVAAGRDLPTMITFATPLNLAAGSYGIALVASGSGHAYTNGTATNMSAMSGDGVVDLSLGSASNVPFTAPTFAPRVWNGSFCTSAPNIGTNYCAAAPNSTGQTAEISAVGSVVVADNNVTLIATNLPDNSFGYFLNSRMQGFVANPGNSQGNLCLGGAIGRYVGPNEVQNSGLTGTYELQLDLTRTPTPTGFVMIMPGETWHFQAWYRDLVGGVATSNFTDAISITFQ
jgi:hypothetical protein